MKKLFFIANILVIFTQLSAHIFFPALDKEIRTEPQEIKYHINLMWINQKLDENQEGIHPDEDKLIEPALEWAALNPDSVINIWFDSRFTCQKAIKNTQKKIKNKQPFFFTAPIIFKDIQELPEVQENKKIFSL